MSEFVFPLRHGILLTIHGEPTLRSVRNFLGAAATHFRSHRDILRTSLYVDGSFQGRLGGADGVLSNPGDSQGQHLPPAFWADAVVSARRRVGALEDMREELDRHKREMSDGPIKDVVALLDQPSPRSHLAALALVMLNSWEDGPFAEFDDHLPPGAGIH